MTDKKVKIQVNAQSHYLVEQSKPDVYHFIWSYDITIINLGEVPVQLLNRHWKITDLKGKVDDVRGPGVVGLQPLINPGKQFTYSSFCQLATPQGTMEGEFEMQTIDEVHFLIEIPKFLLTCPLSTSTEARSWLH